MKTPNKATRRLIHQITKFICGAHSDDVSTKDDKINSKNTVQALQDNSGVVS